VSTITILGATGKVGSKTVTELLNKDHTLRLIARHADKLQQFANKPGVELYAGNSLDGDFLANVFKGSAAVMLMMPGDFQSENSGLYQDQMGVAQIEAIIKSEVKKVLFLSSVGGHTEDHTGIVAGLARQEKRLSELKDVDVLILRSSYFMENFLANIGLIKSVGINGSPIKPDRNFPIIATRDIAKVAAEKLDKLNWNGTSLQPLLGPRDYNMSEVTKVLGESIGKPDLQYIQFSYEQAKQGLKQIGFSDSIIESYLEMIDAINSGIFNLETRNAESTTATTIEEFSKTFADIYNRS
jgi:uncharacterized protein YbjT (DUF2867 family)